MISVIIPALSRRRHGRPGARARGAAGDRRLRLSFAGMQFFVSNYLGPELTDILSSLTCIIVMVVVLKVWRPKTIMRLEGDHPVTAAAQRRTPAARSSSRGCRICCSWCSCSPGVSRRSSWRSTPGPTACCRRSSRRPATGLNGLNVPGLHNLITRVPPVMAAPAPYAAVFTFNWLSASGTACFLATLVTALLLGVPPGSSSASTSRRSSSCRSRW